MILSELKQKPPKKGEEVKEPECPSSPKGHHEAQSQDVNTTHACAHCGKLL